MSQKVTPRRDRTWAVKRALFGTLYRIGEEPAVEWLGSKHLAPREPALALALGEGLVSTPRRVLALTAHPDDLEFFAGGTLKRMALAGSEIHAAVLSDGEKRGNWTDLGGERRREQQMAALLQGYAPFASSGCRTSGCQRTRAWNCW